MPSVRKRVIWIIPIIIASIILVAFAWSYFFPPSLREGHFETAIVDMGPVMKTVPAQGIVEPENEVLLLSPAASVILKIVNGVGSKVNAGDVIMRLDTRPIQDEIEKLTDQLEVKKNNLQKTLLNASSIRVDLGYNVEVKKLKIASLKSDLADQKQLLDVGGISPAKYEKTKQELVLAEKDLQTIQTKNSIRLRQLKAEEKGLRLQIEIQQKELNDKFELLKRMNIRAPSSGIILEINGKEGEKVAKDRLLVRMSDLSTYKIRASIDDKMSDVIKTGKSVYALIDEKRLPGKIGTVSPAIKDRKIEFDVFLEQSDYYGLRPNLNIDLRVVIDGRDSVMRVVKGPAFNESNTQDVYIISGNKAVLHTLVTGLKGDEYIEIISGAEVGDKIIISDVTPMRKVNEVEIHK